MREENVDEIVEKLGRQAIGAVVRLGEFGKTVSPELAERKLLEVARTVEHYLSEVRSEKRRRSDGLKPPL